MTNIRLSVITVCFNAIDQIEKTILSVLNQSYNEYEYIVIDGGSTDGTVDVIKKYEDKIDVFISEADNGIYDAMNKGIRLAKGEYLNFMNAGDYYFSDMTLEKVNSQISDEDFICGIAKISTNKYWIPICQNASATRIAFGHNVNHQASFIKRALLMNGYDTYYPIMADDFFFFRSRITNKCTYRRLWLVTNWYDSTGISTNPANYQKMQSERSHFLETNNIDTSRLHSISFRCHLFFEKACHIILLPYIKFWIEKRS